MSSVRGLQTLAVTRTRHSYRLLQGFHHSFIPRGLKPDFGKIEWATNNITSLTTGSAETRGLGWLLGYGRRNSRSNT